MGGDKVEFDLFIIGSSTKCSVEKSQLTIDWLMFKIQELTAKAGHRLLPSMQYVSIWVSSTCCLEPASYCFIEWKQATPPVVSNPQQYQAI